MNTKFIQVQKRDRKTLVTKVLSIFKKKKIRYFKKNRYINITIAKLSV